jgi:hypothetical protein
MIHMLKNHKLTLLIIILIQLASPLSSVADEGIEDKIHITGSHNQLNAVIDDARNITTRLRRKERVLWEDSNGYLAAVLTNDRFYVVSTTSGSWKEFHLKSEEAESAIVTLSPFIAVLATGDRAVGYNISMNSFFETRLPIHNELITAEAGKHVAVVVTTGKLFGIRKSASSFTEMRLGISEVVEDVDVTSNKVVVRTSDRLLSFVADDPAWTEYTLK